MQQLKKILRKELSTRKVCLSRGWKEVQMEEQNYIYTVIFLAQYFKQLFQPGICKLYNLHLNFEIKKKIIKIYSIHAYLTFFDPYRQLQYKLLYFTVFHMAIKVTLFFICKQELALHIYCTLLLIILATKQKYRDIYIYSILHLLYYISQS